MIFFSIEKRYLRRNKGVYDGVRIHEQRSLTKVTVHNNSPTQQ